jgi:hypothetical protein
MKRLLTVALLLCATPAVAQERLNHLPTPNVIYTWRMLPGEGRQAGLFENGTQVGSYSFETGEYHRLLPGDNWDGPAPPPVQPPLLVRPDAYGDVGTTPGPKGVVTEMLTHRERLLIDGQEVNPNAYFGDRPEANAGAPYLLVAGDDAFLAQAKGLFADGARYAPLKAQWVVGFFPADTWHTRGVGYQAPGCYFLGPSDDRGHSRCYSFQPAPDLEGLDVAAAATLKRIGLRDPDPNFRPDQVPDLRQEPPQVPWAPAGNTVTWGAAVTLGGVGLLYLLARRRAATA